MLTPIKRLGQNFLQDPNTIRRIVDALDAGPDDTVVEIGPGAGALTGPLADRYSRFAAIEIDDRAADLLESELPGVRIIRQDILKTDWSQLASEMEAERLHVIGNLPCYLVGRHHIGQATIMQNRNFICNRKHFFQIL